MDNIALIIDLVFFAAFLVIIIVNTVRGFVKAFMKLGSSIVSVILAGIFSGKLGQVFHDWFMADWLNEKIANITLSAMPSLEGVPDGFTVTINDLLTAMTGKFSLLLSIAGVNMAELSGSYGSLPATEENVLLMSAHIGDNLSMILAKGLAFIVIFLASLLLFALVTSLLNAATELPVIKTANRILGFIFGVLSALIIGSIGSFVVTKAIEIISVFSETVSALHIAEDSMALRLFDKYNLVSLIFDSILK